MNKEIDLEQVRSQLEGELTWRSDEIRLLGNVLENIEKETEKERYRKSLILMLYSHYEGFCKNALLIYLDVLNQAEIQRKYANEHLATASLAKVFEAYENRDVKNRVFKKTLPDDTQLHRFSRQVDFICEFNDFLEEIIKVPENVVNTEDNLWPVVLKKMLFRIGLPFENFSEYEVAIKTLLNKRNNIAHGTERKGINEEEYKQVKEATFGIMNGLIHLIMDALKEKKFLKVIES